MGQHQDHRPLMAEDFVDVLRAHRELLRAFAAPLVRNRGTVDQVVLVAFAIAWRAAKRASPPFDGAGDGEAVRTRLFRLVYRLALRADLQPHMQGSLPSAEHEVLDSAVARIQRPVVGCLLLRVVHYFGVDEIASICGLRAAEVRERLGVAHRGLLHAYITELVSRGAGHRQGGRSVSAAAAGPAAAGSGPACVVLEPLLPLLDLDVLEVERTENVYLHLGTCPSCCQTLDAYATLNGLLRRQFARAAIAERELTLADVIAAAVKGQASPRAPSVPPPAAPPPSVPPPERQPRARTSTGADRPAPPAQPSASAAGNPAAHNRLSRAVDQVLQEAYALVMAAPNRIGALPQAHALLVRILGRKMTPRQRLRASYLLALDHTAAGRVHAAAASLDQALALALRLGDFETCARSAYLLASLCDGLAALDLYASAFEALQQLGSVNEPADPALTMEILRHLVDQSLQLRDYAAFQRYQSEYRRLAALPGYREATRSTVILISSHAWYGMPLPVRALHFLLTIFRGPSR